MFDFECLANTSTLRIYQHAPNIIGLQTKINGVTHLARSLVLAILISIHFNVPKLGVDIREVAADL